MGIALALAALSAVLHATWNIIGKRGSGGTPSLAFFIAAESAAALLMAPLLPHAITTAQHWPAPCWALLAASCTFQATSYICIAIAYRRSDLAASYPLIRALPALVLVMAGSLLGWAVLSPLAITGAVILGLGCLIVPLTGWHAYRRLGRSLADPAILGAALCICGYGITDPLFIRTAGLTPGLADTSALACLMASGNALIGWTFVLLIGRERQFIASILPAWRRCILTGTGIWLSYGTMLLALAWSTHPGPPTAMRQLSIPLAAIASLLLLRETIPASRWAGIAAITAGITCIALGK